jgi:hypothetical protein
METMTNATDAADERDVYSPPSVVRINDLNRGEGQTGCSTGSGDADLCLTNGNSAHTACDFNGNSAGQYCLATGSGGAAPP